MRIPANYPSARGFTLVELMMGLAVAAILFGIALPSFNAMIERQRLIAAQHALIGGFHYARSLAISERRNAAICPSSDGLRCRSGGVWDSGWLIYVDSNRNGQRDDSEPVRRMQLSPQAPLQVRSSSARPQAVFRPNGGSGASNLTLRLCAPDGRLLSALVLNNTGRLRKAGGGSANGRCG
jgi:type IV fimbrial biogenesis protein FimT